MRVNLRQHRTAAAAYLIHLLLRLPLIVLLCLPEAAWGWSGAAPERTSRPSLSRLYRSPPSRHCAWSSPRKLEDDGRRALQPRFGGSALSDRANSGEGSENSRRPLLRRLRFADRWAQLLPGLRRRFGLCLRFTLPPPKALLRFITVAVAGLAWRSPYLFHLPTAAHAKFSYELNESPTVSLRPGMSREVAEHVLATGRLDEVGAPPQAEEVEGAAAPSTSKADSKKAKAKSVYGDDDDEDLLLTEDDVVSTPSTFSSSSGGVARQSDQAAARRLAAQTRSNFAAYHRGKSNALTAKVALALFVPTFGGMFAREFVRRRREELYVKKGLEILEAQKAEYFNVTGTVAADSDVQDALKGLKNPKNTTKGSGDDEDDKDDDEDDDDDDDEKPQYKLRRTPRPPAPKDGGGGGGTGGSRSGGDGSGDNDPGYGRPSDEDLDKLKRLMGRT